MKEYILEFTRIFDYPVEAADHFAACYDRLAADPALEMAFLELISRYDAKMDCDFDQLLTDMKGLCAKAGIHEYTGAFLLLICMTQAQKRYYAAAGLDETQWYTAMLDLKWKLDECRCVYGIWGTFVAYWYSRVFRLRRFAFGKLQFDPAPFGRHYDKNGVTLTPESPVFNVHIPRTGTRLDIPTLRASYAQAAQFLRSRYRDELENRPLVFTCHSWLLFPKHATVLKPGSNLMAFFSDYVLLEEGLYEDYQEVWRLFDVRYDGDVEQLPQDTSLRRTYADWIRNGEKIGWGYGIYIYDTGKNA